jgi:type IV pilus assembly protein PilZ
MTTKKEPSKDGRERRRARRFDVKLHADVSTDDAFLFAYVSNISELGIFLASDKPRPIGTVLKLRFRPIESAESFEVEGEVVWINPVRANAEENVNPGMGVKFINLDDETRERILGLIKTIAYLHDHWV